ncbi:hypothetical protein HAX54_023911, partial [Datura stramonium]|nr:hypothetical protein [Datura stramonium]
MTPVKRRFLGAKRRPIAREKQKMGTKDEKLVETRETPVEHRLNTVNWARGKRRSRYKASGHCLDQHFIGSSWVKTGETPVWCQMSVVYPVFCTAPTTHRHFMGLHLRFIDIPP